MLVISEIYSSILNSLVRIPSPNLQTATLVLTSSGKKVYAGSLKSVPLVASAPSPIY